MVATALAHVLALTTPRPRAFFSWIVGLVTVVGVVLPFASDGSLAGKLATALVDLVIGLCKELLSSVLARTTSIPNGRRRAGRRTEGPTADRGGGMSEP